MATESQKVLEMLESGKITAEEAEKLLSALNQPEPEESYSGKAKWLRVRVYEGDLNHAKVKVNIPLRLVKSMVKLGMKFSGAIPDKVQEKLAEKGINMNLEDMDADSVAEIIDEISNFGPLDLVEVDEKDTKTRVEVKLE